MSRFFLGLEEMPLELLATIVAELTKKEKSEGLDSFDQKRLHTYQAEAKKRFKPFKNTSSK